MAKCFGRRSQIGAAARLETYNVAVADAERAVKEIQEEIFSSVFDSIVNFVATSGSLVGPLIPAAVLLTGVRMINSKLSLLLLNQTTIG